MEVLALIAMAHASPADDAAECPDPDSAIRSAEDDALSLYLAGAQESLDSAVEGFACGRPVSSKAHRRFWQTQAIVWHYQEDARARDAFATSKIREQVWNTDFGESGPEFDLWTSSEVDAGLALLEFRGLRPDDRVFVDGLAQTAPFYVDIGYHILQVGPAGEDMRFARALRVERTETIVLPPTEEKPRATGLRDPSVDTTPNAPVEAESQPSRTAGDSTETPTDAAEGEAVSETAAEPNGDVESADAPTTPPQPEPLIVNSGTVRLALGFPPGGSLCALEPGDKRCRALGDSGMVSVRGRGPVPLEIQWQSGLERRLESHLVWVDEDRPTAGTVVTAPYRDAIELVPLDFHDKTTWITAYVVSGTDCDSPDATRVAAQDPIRLPYPTQKQTVRVCGLDAGGNMSKPVRVPLSMNDKTFRAASSTQLSLQPRVEFRRAGAWVEHPFETGVVVHSTRPLRTAKLRDVSEAERVRLTQEKGIQSVWTKLDGPESGELVRHFLVDSTGPNTGSVNSEAMGSYHLIWWQGFSDPESGILRYKVALDVDGVHCGRSDSTTRPFDQPWMLVPPETRSVTVCAVNGVNATAAGVRLRL